ncbi:MAG: hypothetical protein ACK4VN_02190 [Bacteroidales bacterium]
MNHQLFFAILFLVSYLFVIGFGEYVFRRYKLNSEYVRKVSHAVATLSSLLFLLAFQSYLYVLGLAVVFFVIFFLGRKFGIIRSLESVGRRTAGTYLLPVGIFFLFWFARYAGNELLYILPVLIVGISDPLAGYAGTAWQSRTRKISLLGYTFDKTLLGSSVFFLSAWMISIWVLWFFHTTGKDLLIVSVLVAMVAPLAEAVSEKGFDNLSVPLVVAGVLWWV